jgi:1-acyl-sn-glycerol-3-phosphate acyltransferase
MKLSTLLKNPITKIPASKTPILKNSMCSICHKGLPWIPESVVMLNCNHMYHKSCITKQSKCSLCNIKINTNDLLEVNDQNYKLKTVEQINTRKQDYIDLLSMTNFDNNKIDNIEILKNLPILMNIIGSILVSNGNNGRDICAKVVSMLNLKIKVHNEHLIDNTKKVVYIANHTSYLDFLVLFPLLNSGFLSSDAIYDNYISSLLLNVVKCVIIKRGTSDNTVTQMKKYIDDHKSICLFPEGMMTHPETLIKFRTGAFHIGYDVQPIVIKYKNPIAHMDIGKFILLMTSGLSDNIDVHILNRYQYPFTDDSIEHIRKDMSKVGGLLLSNVSNKDIKDK